MRRLIEGVVRFQGEVYPAHRDLFQQLATTQQPEALLITCSDSRVVPQWIVQAKPGELFVCRNAGNIAPPYGEPTGGVAATIEYAVMALGVKDVIVCGHSDCGAMKALLHPESLVDMPAVTKWLNHAARAETVVRELFGHLNEEERVNALIEENVLAQVDHLRTYPCVASRLRGGTLGLHGWVYNIETGAIRVYDEAKKQWNGLELTPEIPSAALLDAAAHDGQQQRGSEDLHV